MRSCRFHLIHLLILFCIRATAQDCKVPNGSFEDWGLLGVYDEPYGWGSFNQGALFGYPVSVSRTTDAYGGTYAIRIENDTFTDPGTGLPDTLNGTAITGWTLFNDVMGFRFRGKPYKLRGYYKYFPAAPDTMQVIAAFTRWNDSTASADMLGIGIFTASSLSSAYAPFDVFIFYYPQYTGLLPDTCIIALLSGGTYRPQPGSALYIDSLTFSYGFNLAPEAGGDEVVVWQDSSVTAGVLDNDAEPDCNTLTLSLASVPMNGTAVLYGTDSILYTPGPGYSGQDSFRYSICDNGFPSLCDTGMVNVTVLGITGTEEMLTDATAIPFPVPSGDIVTFRLPALQKSIIRITDTAGKTQVIHTSGETILNFQNSAPGIYFFHITNAAGMPLRSGKLVISR